MGRNSLSAGIKITNNNAASIAKYIGSRGLTNADIDVLATLQPTKSTLPTGGVHKPMQRFMIMIMPKWSGDKPRLSATGSNMGVKIKTAGVISINTPTSNKIRLIINKIMMGLSVRFRSEADKFWGMFS